MKLEWSETALAQTDAIHDYISRNSPHFARVVIQRIHNRIEKVLKHPQSGEVVPEFGLPQIRQVMEPPYRIVYRVTAETIEVLGVIHGAMQSPFLDT